MCIRPVGQAIWDEFGHLANATQPVLLKNLCTPIGCFWPAYQRKPVAVYRFPAGQVVMITWEKGEHVIESWWNMRYVGRNCHGHGHDYHDNRNEHIFCDGMYQWNGSIYIYIDLLINFKYMFSYSLYQRFTNQWWSISWWMDNASWFLQGGLILMNQCTTV